MMESGGTRALGVKGHRNTQPRYPYGYSDVEIEDDFEIQLPSMRKEERMMKEP